MSLLAAVRNKRPELGFCPDFLESTAPHLAEIKRRGIRVVTNGGETVKIIQLLSNTIELQVALTPVPVWRCSRPSLKSLAWSSR